MPRKSGPVLMLVASILFLIAAAISARDGGPINYSYLGLGLGLLVGGIALLRKSSSP